MNAPEKEMDIGALMMQDPAEEEIHYDAVPGYRPVFFVILVLAVTYLTYIFL